MYENSKKISVDVTAEMVSKLTSELFKKDDSFFKELFSNDILTQTSTNGIKLEEYYNNIIINNNILKCPRCYRKFPGSIDFIEKVNPSTNKYYCTLCKIEFLITLDEGSSFCEKCNGLGHVQSFWSPNLCMECLGTGVLTWTEELFQKKKISHQL